MQHDAIRNQMRRGVAEQSVQILRRHGKSDEEIRFMLSGAFRLDEKELNEILNADAG